MQQREPNAAVKFRAKVAVGSDVNHDEAMGQLPHPLNAALRVISAAEKRGQASPEGLARLVEAMATLEDAVVHNNDMSGVEGMLLAQATALQSLFVRLVESAYLTTDQPPEHFDMKMRYAFRAQAQCRATLETPSAIKNPPVVFAKQANLSTGPQC
jgi:hypothetical protein